MGIHSFLAIFTRSTRRNTGKKNMISLLEAFHGCASLLNNAHPFVTKNCTWLASRGIAFDNM
jgi:hypothetical protein